MSTPADQWDSEFDMDAPPSAGSSLSPEQMAFVQKIWPHAEAAGKVLGVDPRSIVAQSALESDWGRSQPGGNSNNLFGIKPGSRWTGPTVNSRTTEFRNGIPGKEQADFRRYDSPAASVADHSRLLQDPRYAAALNTGQDFQSYGNALQKAGYATDPEYGNKIASIAGTLPQFQTSTSEPWEEEFDMDGPASQAPQRVSAPSPHTVPFDAGRSFGEALNPFSPDVAPGTSQVGPMAGGYSVPGPHNTFVESPDENMQEIEVSARPQPRAPQPIDPRLQPWEKSSAESTWGETFQSMLPLIGGQVAQWIVGTKEMLNDATIPGARLDLLRTLVLPDAFKRFEANKAAAGGSAFEKDMFNDPAVVQAAQLAGMTPDRFLIGAQDYLRMTPQAQAAKLTQLMPDVARREQHGRDLAFERMSNERAIEGLSPNVEPYSAKWFASGGAQMLPDLGIMAAAGAMGGVPAAMTAMAGSVLPRQYATGKSLNLTPARAGLFAALTSVAELAPELPVAEAMFHTPAGKELLKKAFGRFAGTAAGKASGIGTFEAFSEGLTSVMQDLTKAGMLNEHITLGQLASNAAQASALGFLPGATLAAPGAIKEARKEKAERTEKYNFVGPQQPERTLGDALEGASIFNQLGMNSRGAPTTQAARQRDVAEAQAATMAPPRATGSRAPEAGAAGDSAPTAASTQETASAPPTAASLQQELQEGSTYRAPDGDYAVVAVSPNPDPEKHFIGMRGPEGDLRPWTAAEFAAHIERASGADERQTQRLTQLEETAKQTAHTARAKKYVDLSSALRRPTPVSKEASDERALLTAMAQMHPPPNAAVAKDKGAKLDALIAQMEFPASRTDVENFAGLSSKLREPTKPEPEKSDAEKIAMAMGQMQRPNSGGATNKKIESFETQVADIVTPQKPKNAAPPTAVTSQDPVPTPAPQADPTVSTTQQTPVGGATPTPKAPVAPTQKPATPAATDDEPDPFAPKADVPPPSNRARSLAEHEQNEVNDLAAELREFATGGGWHQKGGKRLKAITEDSVAGEDSPTTKWIAHNDWWRYEVQGVAPLPGNDGGEATRKVVDKALAGEPITLTQYRHVKALVAVVKKFKEEARAQPGIGNFDPAKGSIAASETFGPETTRDDIVDTALVARATELDEVGVERAAIQNETDNQGFMDAIRAIIANHEQAQKADKGGTPVSGADGDQPAAGEGQPVLTPSPGPPATKETVTPRENQGELLPKDKNAQALADAERAKDAKRSPGTQVSPGLGGGLFSDEQKQTDITDQQPAAVEGDDEVVGQDDDVGTAAATGTGTLDLRRPEQETKKAKPASPYSQTRPEGMTSSHFDQIWTQNNLDPRDMELLPPEEKLAKAIEQVKARFGFPAVDVQDGMNVGEAIDVVKDAYAGLSNLANIQNVAPRVMSLNGWVSLALVRNAEGGALASYNPGSHVITMTRRNDAFAHEWAHALDDYILTNFAPDVALAQAQGLLLTGKIRRGGEPQTLDAQVKQAMIDVVNAMFHDQAKAALHVQQLQLKIAKATTPSQKAALQKQLDNFKRGSGRPQGAESQYYKDALAADTKPMEDEDPKSYWQRPTEMFARAFEAYIAHKLAGYDAAHPFVTDSDRMYQKGRNGQFNALYPQAVDRQVIFDALDVLMRAVRDRGLVQGANASALIDATAPTHWKQQVPSLTPTQARQGRTVWGRVKQALKQRREENLRDEASDRARAKLDQQTRNSHLNAANPGDVRRYVWNMGLKIANGWNSYAAAKLTSIQSFMLSVAEKNIGNTGIERIRAWFAPDPGATRGVQNASYETVVNAEKKRLTNKFADIVRAHGMFKFTDEELRNVRDVIVGAEKPLNQQTRDAAASIVEFNNDMHVYMTEAGIDVGYVRENGWMKRVMNPLSVEENLPEFRKQGRRVYESVYEDEIGSMARLTKLDDPSALNSLLKYVSEITRHGAVPEAQHLADQQAQLAKDIVATRTALMKDPLDPLLLQQFQDQVFELREAMREPWAMEALHDWENHIRGIEDRVERFQIEGRGPEGSFTKSRKLPALADELLGDFMITNPLQLTQTYIDQVVRRVQFGKFFGEETSKKPLGWKLNDALSEATKEYTGPDGTTLRANPEDLEELQLSIDTILRQGSRGFLTKKQLSRVATFNAYLLPVFLARSIAAQIAEPFVVGWRTGNIMDGLHVFHSQMQDVAAWLGHQPSKVKAQWRREMANYAGITTDHLADHLLNNRYNLMFQDVGSAKKMARFFMVAGIQPHAMSMRRGAADVMLTRYLPKMAKRAMGTGPQAKQAREALEELGIPISTEVLNEIVQLANIRSVAQLNKLPHFQMIRMAAVTLVDSAILDPKIAHKPRFASQPEMSFMYGIMSMNFAFQREVIQASSKRIVAAWKNNPKIGIATSASVATSAALLAAGQFSMWVLRQQLWAHDDWEEIEKKIKNEGWMQAASRSGFFGAADPLINSYMSLKYDRDLTNLTAGALRGSVLAGAQTVLNLASDRNSPNTAYNEEKATEALWNLGVTPLITSLLLKHVAGKIPLVDAALGITLPWLGSGYVSQHVAEPIAELTGDEYTNKMEKREAEQAKAADPRAQRRARNAERSKERNRNRPDRR